MTASEFAFLALGLVLGVATGSALVVVLGARPPAREVRLTVEHGAVPRRAATLSADAFAVQPGEVARGGPADRRRLDRDAPVNDPPAPSPFGRPPVAIPIMRPAAAVAGGPILSAMGSLPAFPIRTSVPNGGPFEARGQGAPAGRSPAPDEAPSIHASAEDSSPVEPARDPSVDELRIQAVLAAEHGMQAGQPTATALLDAHAAEQAEAQAAAAPHAARLAALDASGSIETPIDGTEVDVADDLDAAIFDPTPAIVRILRGDHRALLATVKALAGEDEAMRRPWQATITGFAEAIIERSIERGILDFPVGNPFWDTFTTEQCRAIAQALASTGHRFDGIDGWQESRYPNYRDLTAAVAAAGLEPRRIRHWPTQEDIDRLYREVTVAADEDLVTESPDLDLDEVRELVGRREFQLSLLWDAWGVARPILAAPVSPA